MTSLVNKLTKYTLAIACVATLALAPSAVMAQSLDNSPSVDDTTPANGLTTQSQTPEPINPLWFIIPIATLAIVVLWFLRPSNRQTSQRHAAQTYSIVGAKGGEATSTQSQYRTDNDVYADSLNDQENRLRRIFDEPTVDDESYR